MLLGWIKLHRQLLDNWIMTEPEALSMWIRFLLEANHETKKKMLNGSLVEIKRGQLLFGLEAFSSRSGISIAKLRRFLKLLEKDGMINRQKTSKYSIITIASYESYQDDDRQIASKSQANSKQIATPKECKNVKNEKNIYTDEFERFWQGYPKKTKKPLAQKSFNATMKKLKESKGFVEFSLCDIQKRFAGREKKYIPDATTYLNNFMWEDDIC